MPGVYTELSDFVRAHRACGLPAGDADPLTPDGYRVWARCPRGARFDRWVIAADAASAGGRASLN